jgi:hypothetical protein
MRKISIILFAFTLVLFSQTLNPPVTGPISSDFGPRNWDGYDWHKGIDYSVGSGTAVSAVEGGNIEFIHSSVDGDAGGWRIRIHGSLAYWTYMHLFSNNPNPTSGNWEAGSVTLEDPDGQYPNRNRYVFILWRDRDHNRAERVLTQYTQDVEGWYVQRGGDYIRDENGEILTTQDSVGNQDVIGPREIREG